MFDKRILRKLFIIIVLITIIIIGVSFVRRSLSRYQSSTTITASTDIAFWIVDDTYQMESIEFTELYPSSTPFQYNLCTVSNFKDGRRCETLMEYYLTLTVTTNLPLDFEIKRNDEASSCYKNEQIIKDADGTFYKQIIIKQSSSTNWRMGIDEDITDSFKLYITFPKAYNNEALLADLIEYAKLEVNALQVTENDV